MLDHQLDILCVVSCCDPVVSGVALGTVLLGWRTDQHVMALNGDPLQASGPTASREELGNGVEHEVHGHTEGDVDAARGARPIEVGNSPLAAKQPPGTASRDELTRAVDPPQRPDMQRRGPAEDRAPAESAAP